MADIIIIAVLATAVFFILRSRLGRLRRGECAGGCSGCGGSCGSCAGCAGDSRARGAGEKA